jgi:hypothetical protein
MIKVKIGYNLLANIMVILIPQIIVDEELCDSEDGIKKSGIITTDVKLGLPIQLKRPGFNKVNFNSRNATGPVVSVKKEGIKIFAETKDSGVSAPITYRVEIKYSVNMEFRKYMNF